MDRRQLLTRSVGSLAAIAPKRVFSRASPHAERPAPRHFLTLWREGHLAYYFSDHRRARSLFEQACTAAGLDSEPRADAAEMLSRVREALERDEKELAPNRKEVEADPTSLAKRLDLADCLDRLGRYEEAQAEYAKILLRAAELTPSENAALWPRIGWHHYRHGRYAQAAEWFDRTPETLSRCTGTPKTPEQLLLRHIEAEATLNRLLASVALGRISAARVLAEVYVAQLGRLPWPHRLLLFRSGIDADALYARHLD